LGAIIAAGAAIASASVTTAASGAIAATDPYQDRILFALLSEAKAIDIAQSEADAASEAAEELTVSPDQPIALTPRPGDNQFVRPQSAEFTPRDIHWLRGTVEDVEKLGPATVLNLDVVTEIKTRGREIVDAWDSWQADVARAKEASGYSAAERRCDEISDQRQEIWRRIAATRAKTVKGMLAKLAFVAPLYNVEDGDGPGSTGDHILDSVAMDYSTLHGLNGREART
jgi:hypothetical protein